MKLPIAQLMEGENPFHFDSRKETWLAEALGKIESNQGIRLDGPLVTDLKLTKLEPDYYLRGRMDYRIHQTCARCAESFVLPIEHSFEVALAHVNQARPRTAALSEESDELDICFFEGNDLELLPLLEEQFFLGIPYQAVCRTNCQGICQRCGANRNQAECSCSKELPLNAFSALRGLKL